MVRVIKRTMVLDISGLPATLGRFAIAKVVGRWEQQDEGFNHLLLFPAAPPGLSVS